MTKSFLERNINPLAQAAATLILGSIIIALGLKGEQAGIFSEDPIFPWVVMATMVLSYGIFSCVLSFSQENQNKYWIFSLAGFAIVLVLGAYIAFLFSGIPLSEAKSLKWIYFVLGMCYFIFFAMTRTMRKIIKLAQKQDARMRGEK